MKVKKVEKHSIKAETKSRIYIWNERETLLENLHNRMSRPSKLYRSEILPQLVKKGLVPKDTKLS